MEITTEVFIKAIAAFEVAIDELIERCMEGI